jgi:hypothetical protein
MQVFQRSPFWVAVYKLGAIFGAILFVVAAFNAHVREDAFSLRGVATETMPVKGYTEQVARDVRSGLVAQTRTSADLSFRTEDGETHTVTRGLDGRQLQLARAGQPLRVEYLREQPESTLRLAGQHEEPLMMLTFAVGLAMVSWVLRRE